MNDPTDSDDERPAGALSRRSVITTAAAAVGGALLARLPADAQAPTAQPAVPTDPTAAPGPPTSALGERSPFVRPARAPTGVITGSSLTPLQDLTGTITPSDLVFERHHAGVAMIDPARYRLLIHGLVDRPTVFTLDDLRRLPSVSRVHFLECSGNGRAAYRAPKRDMAPQQVDGLTSNGEWTGISLKTLFREVGVQRGAAWFRAEGGDAARLSRSIPAELADDALIAYAFNGEPLRPANGYPARLLVPGCEGSSCVKWVRRIELAAEPAMFRDETARYTDPLPDGTARQFSLTMDAKSVITHPAYPAALGAPGWVQISGLAWSGRGRIHRVDVSTDGGQSWTVAELQEPVAAKAHTRFRLPWRWDGQPATLMSRAVDETGYVQPSLATFRERRGPGTDYHYNSIRAWAVEPDGRVYFASGV